MQKQQKTKTKDVFKDLVRGPLYVAHNNLDVRTLDEVPADKLERISQRIHKNFVANDIGTWYLVGEEWCPVQEKYKKVYWIPTNRITKISTRKTGKRTLNLQL